MAGESLAAPLPAIDSASHDNAFFSRSASSLSLFVFGVSETPLTIPRKRPSLLPPRDRLGGGRRTSTQSSLGVMTSATRRPVAAVSKKPYGLNASFLPVGDFRSETRRA